MGMHGYRESAEARGLCVANLDLRGCRKMMSHDEQWQWWNVKVVSLERTDKKPSARLANNPIHKPMRQQHHTGPIPAPSSELLSSFL